MLKSKELIREKSRNLVLNALKKEAKRFKDLKEITGLSLSGLNEIRKILLEDKSIEKVTIDNIPMYQITKKGKISLVDESLLNKVHTIQSRGGKIYHDYSEMFNAFLGLRLPWGLNSELVADKKIKHTLLLSSEDVESMEQLIIKKIINNLKKYPQLKKSKGELLLNFEMDLEKIIDSIEKQSLEYLKKISTEEKKLLEKSIMESEEFTFKEELRLKELREKTYLKINKSKS